MNRNILYCAIMLLLVFTISPMATAAERSSGGPDMVLTEAQQDARKTVMMSTTALHEMAASRKLPDYILDRAKGVVIVPHVVKAGLIIGGRWGRGVLMTRNQQGQWSLPVFVSLGGGSIGAQVGVEQSDLLLVFNDEFAIQKLLQSKNFTLGLDASVAAGPLGAKGKMQTGSAAVVSYQRNKGLFVGLDLTGGVLHLDTNPTIAYYQLNHPSTQAYFGKSNAQMAENIMSARKGNQKDHQLFRNVPESAQNLVAALDQLTSRQ